MPPSLVDHAHGWWARKADAPLDPGENLPLHNRRHRRKHSRPAGDTDGHRPGGVGEADFTEFRGCAGCVIDDLLAPDGGRRRRGRVSVGASAERSRSALVALSRVRYDKWASATDWLQKEEKNAWENMN